MFDWTGAALIVTALAVFAAVLVAMVRQAPNVPDRVDEILERSRHHRQTLEAYADELAALHGYGPGDPEYAVLRSVVIGGRDYPAAMIAIMERFTTPATKRDDDAQS